MASRKKPSAAASATAAKPAFAAASFVEPPIAFEPETVAEISPAFEPAPFLEPIPSFEPTPVLESAPVLEQTPAFDSAPVFEPAPVFESALAFVAAPILDSAPMTEHPPVVEPAPEPAPLMEVAPVMEDNQYMEPAPYVESSPVPAPKAEEIPAPFAHVAKIMEAPMASMTEAQGKVRSMVETGLTESHSKFSRMKTAADEAAHAFETSYATIKNGAVQINVKALEALTATAEANFAFFKSVFAVKSPSDYVMLQTEFARKQIELMTAHTKAFGELAQKVAVETVEPIKAQVTKTFHIQ